MSLPPPHTIVASTVHEPSKGISPPVLIPPSIMPVNNSKQFFPAHFRDCIPSANDVAAPWGTLNAVAS